MYMENGSEENGNYPQNENGNRKLLFVCCKWKQKTEVCFPCPSTYGFKIFFEKRQQVVIEGNQNTGSKRSLDNGQRQGCDPLVSNRRF